MWNHTLSSAFFFDINIPRFFPLVIVIQFVKRQFQCGYFYEFDFVNNNKAFDLSDCGISSTFTIKTLCPTMSDIQALLSALEVFNGAPDKASLERANSWLQDFQHSVNCLSPVANISTKHLTVSNTPCPSLKHGRCVMSYFSHQRYHIQQRHSPHKHLEPRSVTLTLPLVIINDLIILIA